MKESLLIIFTLLLSLSAFSQKIKIKDDVAYVDGKAYVKWVSRALGTEISVSSINGEEDLFITPQKYCDNRKITESNPDGSVSWWEFNFFNVKKKCEISSRFPKGLVKLLFLNKIYLDGQLNLKNVDKLISKYGTKYSDNRPEQTNVKVIINN